MANFSVFLDEAGDSRSSFGIRRSPRLTKWSILVFLLDEAGDSRSSFEMRRSPRLTKRLIFVFLLDAAVINTLEAVGRTLLTDPRPGSRRPLRIVAHFQLDEAVKKGKDMNTLLKARLHLFRAL